MSTASAMEGAATSRYGARQLVTGPSMPASI